MNRKKLLISGSAGFIFSNFIRQSIYEKYPYEIVSVDKIANSSMLNNIYQDKLHEFYPADICDEHIMDKIFDYVRPDIVLNGAAEASVDKSITDPNVFIKSNVLGVQNLINLSLKYKIEMFMQASTDEVMGSLGPSDPLWTEESPLNPRSAYSASKASAELLVKAAHETHGLNYLISRSCNVYGMRQTSDKLIPRTIKQIINNKPIPIYGNGKQMRDWIQVNDHCSALLTLLEKGKRNEVYNIGHNQEITNIDLVSKIIKIMGKGEIEFVKDRLGHDFRYGIDTTKLKNLGWKPIYKCLDDGLPSVIDWYQNNRYFL